MAKPVILSVDDDPDVLAAIARDLRLHYQNEYRIIKAGSPEEALDVARQLKKRGTPIALFLVDERMPHMTGTQFLGKVAELHPESRKVLLTAYADTEVAIQGINTVGLDHYLVKPWDPPDQLLYPVLDDLLAEWAATVRVPYDGIRVVGAQGSPQSYAVKEFLSRNQVPYQWIDVDVDAPTRELVSSLAGGLGRLPVVLFPDGQHLVAPSTVDLAEKAGLKTKATRPFYDLVIIGGGPAGLANAVYGASEGLTTLMIEESAPGGQAGTSSRIENYLGFPKGLSGADLANRATAQARRFGAELLTAQTVVGLRREDPYRIVTLADGSEVASYAVVIAAGMEVRTLEATGIEQLLGIGAYYGAAMTEAATYRDREVCVVGGANSAGQGALFFSRYAKRVTMLVRAVSLSSSMSQYLIDRITATENIEVVNRVEVKGVTGDDALESVHLQNLDSGEDTAIIAAGMFIFIGTSPCSGMVAGIVELDEKEFILTGADLPRHKGRPRGWTLDRDPLLFETSMPGVFAAGDVRSGAYRRVAAAVGEGSAAIYSVHRYLKTV
jgi:thioredoxin reductase (NADPH)